MPAQALVDEHRQEVADVVAVAQADMIEQWSDVPVEDAQRAKVAAQGIVTDVVAVYGPMAASVGADWYMESRVEARAPGRFTPKLTVPMSLAQIAPNAGWAVSPLFGVADETATIQRLAAVTQKLVANADRATIFTNARRDPQQVRWYRGTSAKCCAFCAMSAGRGAVYRSQDSADFKPHNNCRCFPVPLWPSETHELPSYYDNFGSEYDEARKATIRAGEKPTAKAILSHWRAATGRA